jgi:hypothetical protein
MFDEFVGEEQLLGNKLWFPSAIKSNQNNQRMNTEKFSVKTLFGTSKLEEIWNSVLSEMIKRMDDVMGNPVKCSCQELLDRRRRSRSKERQTCCWW